MTAEVIEADDIAKKTVKPTFFRNSYRNNKCVWLMPTRGMIPLRVHVSLRNAAWLPNTPRGHIEIEKMEVAAAYEEGFAQVLDRTECKDMPFVWTYEEDNVQPRDVFFKLFEAMWTCIDCGVDMPSTQDGSPAEPWECRNGHRGLDAVAGLYRTKSEPSMAMCFGDPKIPNLDFRPINVEEAEAEGKVIECNGVAMGSTLWRKSLFERLSRPWFKTLTGAESDAIGSYTQDLYLCRKAKLELGLSEVRFAVHTGVSVAHLDIESGELF